MKLDVDNKEKKALSLIFEYYRLSSGMKQSEFIYFNESYICSLPTYNKIENGLIIASEEIYSSLLERVGLLWGGYEELKNFENNVSGLLLDAIEQFHADKVEYILIQSIKSTKSYCFLVVLQRLLLIIKKSFCEKIIIDNDDSLFLEILFHMFEENTKDIIRELLVNKDLNTQSTKEKCFELIEKFDFHNSSSSLTKLNTAIIYSIFSKEIDALMIISKLENTLREQNNMNRLLDLLKLKILIYNNIQPEDMNVVRNQALYFIDANQDVLDNNRIFAFYYTLATMYFDQCKYDEAHAIYLEILNNAQENNEQLGEFVYLFYFYSCSVIKEKPIEKIIKLNINSISSQPDVRKMLEYFHLKFNNTDYLVLEDFIVNKVSPCLDGEESLINRIYINEMNEIISYTKNYYLKRTSKYLEIKKKLIH